jgi:hypothetical protein
VARVPSLVVRHVIGCVRVCTDDPLIPLDFGLNLHETPLPRAPATHSIATRTHAADRLRRRCHGLCSSDDHTERRRYERDGIPRSIPRATRVTGRSAASPAPDHALAVGSLPHSWRRAAEDHESRLDLGFDSYDRFFPNQDTLPQGGFRNRIALRQQKPRRGDGSSVFLDDRGSIQLDVVSTTSSERRTRCPALNSPSRGRVPILRACVPRLPSRTRLLRHPSARQRALRLRQT